MPEDRENHDESDLGFLQEMIDAVRTDAPEEAECRTAQRTLIETLESSRKENVIMSILRKTGSMKIRWAAASVIAAVAVVSVIVFAPWGGGAGDLYAAAVDQLNAARSLTFTFSSDEDPGTATGMEMAYKEPGRLRYTFPTGDYTIMDLKQRKAIMVKPARKTYRYWNFPDPTGEKRNDVIDRLRSLPERADEVIEKREMDGRTVQGFRVNQVEEKGMNNVVVWVDVETKDPVRVEGESSEGHIGRTIRMIMRNFDFTADLDDALFDLTPPEGFSTRPIYQIDPSQVDSTQIDS